MRISLTTDSQQVAQQNAASRRASSWGNRRSIRCSVWGVAKDSPILDKNFPVLEGAIHHTYAYEGWRIRAAFLPPNGPAVRMEYSKIVKPGVEPTIQDYELQAIMTANTPPGTTWKQIVYNNPDSPNKGLNKILRGYLAEATGQEMWQRSDGAISWLRSNIIVRLELPAARDYATKLKAEKEQKARESVPQF